MTNAYTAVAFTTVTSTSRTEGSVPASFDAFLHKPLVRGGQLKLTINLRIKFRPLPPKPLFGQRDHDPPANKFWTSEWKGPDWQRFLIGAAAQADMWNNKFWLLPPPSFSEFDIVFDYDPSRVLRPNIRCELVVDFDAKAHPHKTIEVANLNTNIHGGADAGTFRSDAALYDTMDAVPWVFPYGPTGPRRQPVIAHEIGHLIGLGHIGVILKTPLCTFAQSGMLPNDDSAKGGTDSRYCYGFNQSLAVSGNIMGAGDRFTVEDARPWRWAISAIRKKGISESAQWQVVLQDPGPASVHSR